jgi:hypothetical protein
MLARSACHRDQELLVAPSLASFVLDSVAELDLDAFYSAYRSEGWGAGAHDPQRMVALGSAPIRSVCAQDPR